MRGLKTFVTRIGFVGSFALAMLAQGATARADSSAPDNFWNTVERATPKVVVPHKVRAVRTASKPAPPIGISVTSGTLTYLKSHHRDPVMVFEVKLSRAPGKNEVTVHYQSSSTNPLADSDFLNVNGNAIFHGSSVKYKIYVPVVVTLGTTPAGYVEMQLSDPFDGAISNGTGYAALVAKGHVR